MYKIGRYCFSTKEYFEELIKANLLREYDTSPQTREQHDREAIYNKEGVKIKLTEQERYEYWRRLLNYTKPKKVIQIE